MSAIEYHYYWLSFVDSEKPEGERFIGATIVRSDCIENAIRKAWWLRINPGGEVMGIQIPPEQEAMIKPGWENRLISQAELNAEGMYSKYQKRRKKHAH